MDEGDYSRLVNLVHAARGGDIQAYGHIVALTRTAVESAARLIVHDPEDAEDVAQETYLRAYRGLQSLQDPGSLLAWLLRIARNLALNRQRAIQDVFVGDIDVSEIAEPEPDADKRQPALAHAMVTLAADERRLCERYYHGGWTTTRLANEMGISEAAVRKRLQRVRDRLRRKMSMNDTDLPQRIVELLSKPNLTALPENPVGAIWEEFRREFEGFSEVELPEKIDPDEIRRILQDGSGAPVEDYLAGVSRQQWLRRELTAPMLMAAAKERGASPRLIATGKCYRIEDEESSTKLHAFHQAEALWIEEDLSEWGIMGPFTGFIERLSSGARLKIEQTEYSLYCDRGWQVSAQWPGKDWNSIAGWGRMKTGVVERLGYDPSRFVAVGLGVGLERIAMLRYDIDDIRRMEAERI